MKLIHASTLALALAAAYPAHAQSNADILKELQALKAKVSELESRLQAQAAKEPAATAPTPSAQWGMTPEQTKELNRVSIKSEALEDAVEAQGLKMLKIAGYIDPSYIWNQRQHRAGFQFLNPVANDGYNYDNSYFGVASVDFQKEMEGGIKWRLTLMPNRGAGSIADPGNHSVVHEASVSVPLGDLQTRFLAGQIPDWSGYEYIQPTLTKLVTRGLLLDFTEPTAYTGVGMEYIRDKWDVKWLLANFNTTKQSANERSPVLAYRVDYSKGEFQGFGFAGVHGKVANFRTPFDANGGVATNPVSGELYSTANTLLNLFEADAYFIRGDWTWQGQIGFGGQKRAAISADPVTGELRDSSWVGLSTLLAYKFMPRWEAVVRLDHIRNSKNGGGLLGYSLADNRNGLGHDGNLVCDSTGAGNAAECDKGANRSTLAVGFNWLLNLNTTFKAEYRLDHATQPVFYDVATGTYRKTNQLFGTSVVVSF